MAHILLAEDDLNISDLLVRFLARLGHTTQVARDGLVALGHLDSQPFDLLIVDLSLPRLAGEELIRRAKGAAIDTPVIVSSGRAIREQEVAPLADAVLPKPFMLSDLQSLLGKLLPVAGPEPRP